MPPLQLFLPHGTHGKPWDPIECEQFALLSTDGLNNVLIDDEMKYKYARVEIFKWWKLKCDEQYVWDNFKELEAYCKNDVMLLAKGCLSFQQIIIQQTTVDTWETKKNEKIVRGNYALLEFIQVFYRCLSCSCRCGSF